MKIALDAARFTPAEANQLRKAMATFRSRGMIELHEEKMVGRMVARGYDPEFAAALLQPDQGLRRIRLPRKPRRELRAPGLRLELAQVPLPGRVRLRAAQFAADGLLRPGADRPRCERAWRRGARRRRQSFGVGLHAGGWTSSSARPERSRRAWHTPCRRPSTALGRRGAESPCASACARSTACGSSRPPGRRGQGHAPYADVAELRRRSAANGAAIERLAAADCFRSLALDRRPALWDARTLNGAPDLPLFAVADARDEGGRARSSRLPAMPLCEEVVADYQTQRLSLKAHPMSFLRGRLRGTRVRARRRPGGAPERPARVSSPGWC